MGIATSVQRETLAVAYGAAGGWVSAHTTDPGSTGTGEALGGTPTYARKQTAWTADGTDGVNTGSQIAIDVPPGTYPYIGLWSLASGGVFLDKVAVSTPPVFSTQGQLLVTPTFTQT
jgi:hypothetical protein